MPLVINGLGGIHTHAHTHTRTRTHTHTHTHMHTHTHTHTHIDFHMKVISKNQVRAGAGLKIMTSIN